MTLEKPVVMGLWLVGGLGSFSVSAQSLPNLPTSLTSVPRADSVISYFPAQAAQDYPQGQPSDTVKATICQYIFRSASECLMAFQAPVLSDAYHGPAVYRFIWLRSFHQPVLLTLERTESGGKLLTQLLNKHPNMGVPTLPNPDEPGIPSEARQRRLKLAQKMAHDKRWQAELAFAKAPAVAHSEPTVLVGPAQMQQFSSLLDQADFWQTPSCGATFGTDGAAWLLEARLGTRYHVTYRQSPAQKTQFRQYCEFLLNLSPARRERRY
jgi:hypothetical protein